MPVCTMCEKECYATAEGSFPKSHCCGVAVRWSKEEIELAKITAAGCIPDYEEDKTLSFIHKPYIDPGVEGRKDDTEKPRMDLLPFEALEEVAKVLTFGAKKYAANTWQKVKDAEGRYVAALLRHLSAYNQGKTFDEESGLSHAAHMATNALFILWFEIQATKKKYLRCDGCYAIIPENEAIDCGGVPYCKSCAREGGDDGQQK